MFSNNINKTIFQSAFEKIFKDEEEKRQISKMDDEGDLLENIHKEQQKDENIKVYMNLFYYDNREKPNPVNKIPMGRGPHQHGDIASAFQMHPLNFSII